MNELNAIHEPGADQPTPDPSQEGDWPTGTLPSWEGLGVGSWSQCMRKSERELSMNHPIAFIVALVLVLVLRPMAGLEDEGREG